VEDGDGPVKDVWSAHAWRIPYLHGDRTLHLVHPPHNAPWYSPLGARVGRTTLRYRLVDAGPLEADVCLPCLLSVLAFPGPDVPDAPPRPAVFAVVLWPFPSEDPGVEGWVT
jgi:hypothetical protein